MEPYQVRMFLTNSNYSSLSNDIYTYRHPSGLHKCIRVEFVSIRVNTSSSYRNIYYVLSNLVGMQRYQPSTISETLSDSHQVFIMACLGRELFDYDSKFWKFRTSPLFSDVFHNCLR